MSGSLTKQERKEAIRAELAEHVDFASLTDVAEQLRKVKVSKADFGIAEEVLTEVALPLYAAAGQDTWPITDPDTGEKLIGKVVTGMNVRVDVSKLVSFLQLHAEAGNAEAAQLLERIAPRKAVNSEFEAAIDPDGLLTPEVAAHMFREEPKSPYILFNPPVSD